MSAPLVYLYHAARVAAAAAQDAAVADLKARTELAKLAPIQPGGIVEYVEAWSNRRKRFLVDRVTVIARQGALQWHYAGWNVRADGSTGRRRDDHYMAIDV